MKHASILIIFILWSCVSPLFAETKEERERLERTEKFLRPIPRLELPGELKTYVIDKKTGKVVRSFDGFLRDYWPDLDIILTEVEHPSQSMVIGIGNDAAVLTLWNRSTGKKIREVGSAGNRSFDSDDSIIRIIERKAFLWNNREKTTEVVDLTTGKSLGTLPGFVKHIVDSVFIVQGADNLISICDAESLEVLHTMPGVKIQLSDDHSRFATWVGSTWMSRTEPSGMADVTIYELKTGRKIHTFPEMMDVKKNWDWDIKFNHDGTKLLMRTAAEPAEVVLWDVDAGQKIWSIPFGGKERSLYAFHFPEDGKIITGMCEPQLPHFPDDWPRFYVWNAQTGEEILSLRSAYVEYFSETNRLLDRDKKEAVLYDTETGKRVADVVGYFTTISEDGKRFLTSEKTTLHLRDAETGELLRQFRDDGVFSDYNVYRRNYELGATRLKVTIPNNEIDSHFAAYVFLFDTESGEVISREEILPDGENRHGQTVWKDGRQNIVFWNAETGQPIFTIRLKPSWYISGPAHFTPDGEHLIYSTKQRPHYERYMN